MNGSDLKHLEAYGKQIDLSGLDFDLIEKEFLKSTKKNTIVQELKNKVKEKLDKNGGIDFVYIGTGIYLRSRGNKRDDVKAKGYGSSVIMQGGFLLLFDATIHNLQRTNGRKMRQFLEKNAITFTGVNVGITHSF